MKNSDRIFKAYLQVVNEAAEPKFKVGDQVGIGSSPGHGYVGNDTGTVTKVNKFGHHTVEFHNIKSPEDASKPLTQQFDSAGKSRNQYSYQRIIPKVEHDALIKTQNDKRERNADLNSVIEHINDHRLGGSGFAKISKESAAHIKAMIDKHTAEE